MAYTVDQIDAIVLKLESALATGAARVTFEGRSIEYRTAKDIQTGIAYFRSLYDNVTGSTVAPKIRTLYGYTNKGFGNL